MKVQMQKPDAEVAARVGKVMADLPVYPRPMFGCPAWFVEANAQLLGCVWGDALCIRVGAEETARLVASGKATPFDPMGGRPMREYVLVPAASMRPAQLRKWVERGLAFTETVAAKKGK